MSSAILSWAEPASPHRRKVASADAMAEKQVVEFAVNRLNLLSESQPKKVEDMIPGILKLWTSEQDMEHCTLLTA
jgi:hypothetical protein